MKKLEKLLGSYKSVCEACNVPYKLNINLAKISYARIGGKVLIGCYPFNEASLVGIISAFREKKLAYKIVGNTTNILFLDSVEYSCLVFIRHLDDFDLRDERITVSSGRMVSDFCRDLAKIGRTGAEGLEGLPGTIGGALVMNAGAYGYTISDFLISVKVMNEDSKVSNIARKDMVFLNRSSPTLNNKIILSATFKFPKGLHEKIEKKMRRFHISRHQYQEWVYPNLGSIFIVPTLDINKTILKELRKIHPIKAFLVKILLKIWYFKPNFFVRRSFPEFNFPQILLKSLRVSPYSYEEASKCTINTFTNKNYSSLEILEYMEKVKEASGKSLELENEIVFESISKIVDKEVFENETDVIRKINE